MGWEPLRWRLRVEDANRASTGVLIAVVASAPAWCLMVALWARCAP